MSLHRACCCEPGSCCSIWCSCPERIYVSFCKVIFEKNLYSCLAVEGECYPAVGDPVGASFRTVTVKNVVFERKTGTDPVTLCTNCCYYEVVTGAEQTGTISYHRDEWYIWCAEEDGENCVYGNKECDATSTHQLSGSTASWNQMTFNGRLYLECCDPTLCQSGSVRAKLDLGVIGVSVAGTVSDCCTQQTTGLTTEVRFQVDYDWDCRDRSRWVGTCPCDLMDENGTGTIVGYVASCLDGLDCACPCPTVGQGCDYPGLCIVNQSASIYFCSETTESLECVPTGNGYITGITGCA